MLSELLKADNDTLLAELKLANDNETSEAQAIAAPRAAELKKQVHAQ